MNLSGGAVLGMPVLRLRKVAAAGKIGAGHAMSVQMYRYGAGAGHRIFMSARNEGRPKAGFVIGTLESTVRVG